MPTDHLVLCGGAPSSSRQKRWVEAKTHKLSIGKGKNQVRLRLDHLTRRMASALDDVSRDLIEIASYVYVADQTAKRGGLKEFEYGEKWRRRFRFEIPVRQPDHWNSETVREALCNLLCFMTDDDYEFVFRGTPRPAPFDRWLFGTSDDESDFREVMLFSGGLDSFGGAVQEIVQGQRKVVLVSHRPANQMYARQASLVSALRPKLADKHVIPLHVAVEVNKGKDVGREFTQRCRSFLFGVLAATVATSLNLQRIRFYENGITSLHLPIGFHILGGRATRTTHPRTLRLMSEFLGLAFGSPIDVENPFLWKTKSEVLAGIKAAGCSELCSSTCSCTRTKETTNQHTHCGRCSQCIDRRLCAIGAGLDDNEDPPEMYRSCVLTGECDGSAISLVERYIGTARKIDRMGSSDDLFAEFGEAARALTQVGMRADMAAENVFDLYKRHARSICSALSQINIKHSALVISLDYPANSLLGVAVGRGEEGGGRRNVAVDASDPPSGKHVVLDPDQFSVVYGKHTCELRNTKEFALFERLHRRIGQYFPHKTLIDDVWEGCKIEKNTIQRTASNLRRKLREDGIPVIVDGTTNQGHYALKLTPQ